MNGFAKWDQLKHFHPDSSVDQWGDPHKMDFNFLFLLDNFRTYLNVPLIVAEGYFERRQQDDPNHIFHGYGCAAKVVAPDYEGHILDLFFDAMSYPFSGVGIYPKLIYRGETMAGLQLDLRRDIHDHKFAHFWIGYQHRKRNRSTDVTFANLKAHGIL